MKPPGLKGYGLLTFGGGVGYAGNSFNQNDGGTVNEHCIEAGPNICDGNTTCP